MKTITNKAFIFTLVLIASAHFLFAQGDKASRPSAPATATGKIGTATITISYSSPSVKGRKIWGELVPYGKVWRAGANEATIFETDKDVLVEGKKLPAGKYSLYALPGEKEWEIIINSKTGQWGIERSGETTRVAADDILVVKVKPTKSTKMNEKLLYEVSKDGVVLKWENLQVPIAIRQ